MPTIYENTKYKPNEIGIFTGLPMPKYRASPGVAESDLQILIDNPAAFAANRRMSPTPDMEFGTLFHSLLLDGKADYKVAPASYPVVSVSAGGKRQQVKAKRGAKGKKGGKKVTAPAGKPWTWAAKYCKDWRGKAGGKPILRAAGINSMEMLQAMVKKTTAHPMAKALLAKLRPEVCIFGRHTDYPVLCKGRLDGLIMAKNRKGGAIVVEVKTTRNASTAAFSREIMKRGYYRKAAWYRMILQQLRIAPVEFWYIAVEKSATPRVNVRRLQERAMDKGDLDNDDSLALLKKCKLSRFWPEFPDATFPGETSAPFIDLPDYAYGAIDDQITGLSGSDEETEKK